jgi:hypothetical protein
MIGYLGLVGVMTVMVVLLMVCGKYIRYVRQTEYIQKKNEELVAINDRLEKTNDTLERVLPEKEVELQVEYNRRTEEAIDGIHQNVNEVQTRIISQALSGQSAKELQSNMKTLIETTYSRMTQEFIGSLADETDGLVRDLNDNVCDRIWDSVQQMKMDWEESPYILPRDAVIAYTKGNRTVVVVEQKPQVRTMGFTPDLVGRMSRGAAVSTSQNAYRFTLSFPYVYFFMVFDGSTFKYYEIFFRSKPLTSAREHVYRPPLPNVHSDKKNYRPVCMGTGFANNVRSESTVARQCETVVSGFWQRPFNEHLGNGMTKATDKRLKNYATWQKETEKDPMFILSVKWGTGKTAKTIMDNMFKMRDKDKSDEIDKKIRGMLDKGVKGITKTLKDAIDSAKKNNTLRAGNLDPAVKQQLETVVVDHTKRVFEHCAKE